MGIFIWSCGVCRASNSAGGRSPRDACRRLVLNQATYATIASSSWLRVRQTRSAINSVLKLSTKLWASALMLLCQGRLRSDVAEVCDEKGKDAAGDVAHQAAADLLGALALGGAARDVVARLG